MRHPKHFPTSAAGFNIPITMQLMRNSCQKLWKTFKKLRHWLKINEIESWLSLLVLWGFFIKLTKHLGPCLSFRHGNPHWFQTLFILHLSVWMCQARPSFYLKFKYRFMYLPDSGSWAFKKNTMRMYQELVTVNISVYKRVPVNRYIDRLILYICIHSL